MDSKVSRLFVVDALRGFAIVSIMLLHNIEHFDYYSFPKNLPDWMNVLDKGIWDTLFFLFGGKSYAMFALLFGLTFFIQSYNQEQKGKDFRARFAWRLVLLFVFGFINSSFYQGDILITYAIIGFVLIPVAKLSNKAVFIIALVLILQPYEWYIFIKSLQFPDFIASAPTSSSYFSKMGEYIPGNSIVKTWVGNITNGKPAVLYWTWESGRVFQTAALFMFGMLAGRKSLFATSETNKRFWLRVLIISSIAFIPLFILKSGVSSWISSKYIGSSAQNLATLYSNMAFMLVLVSGFVLLFQTKFFYRILNVFTPLGRMSLSNYVIQSVIGSSIYYGYGLGMYQYTGSLYCVLIGITLATLQIFFCRWWFKAHKHGPLEFIWHKATWIGAK
jgi:uncharacterized protein